MRPGRGTGGQTGSANSWQRAVFASSATTPATPAGQQRAPPGAPDYTAADLATDALAVLDTLNVRACTVIGLSMGGGIAQRLAELAPERISGLMLMSTSPAGDVDEELPPPAPQITSSLGNPPPDPDWTDKDAVVNWAVDGERAYAGQHTFDEETLRELIGRVWDRTPSMESATRNHFLVAESAPPVDMTALHSIPAVVIHGSDDPLFPLRHGEVLAETLNAPLMVLPGVGHQLPPPNAWPHLVDTIAGLANA